MEKDNNKNFGPIKTWKFGPNITHLTGTNDGMFQSGTFNDYSLEDAFKFDLDISKFVRHVTDMTRLFRWMPNFNQDISNWCE